MLRCGVAKLRQPHVDDRYLDVVNLLISRFSSETFRSARDYLMQLTFQQANADPLPDAAILKALRDFVDLIYEVRNRLQSNADQKGGAEETYNNAKRVWIVDRLNPSTPLGAQSIQSCFPQP
jgi:hypothetical protein